MLLSRFWYVVLSLAFGAAVFVLYLGGAFANRAADTTMRDLLGAASNSVEWFLRDDAHARAGALVELCFNKDVQAGLSAAADAPNISEVKERDKVKAALRAFADKQERAEREATTDQDKADRHAERFSHIWAIDPNGRVVANYNYDQTGTNSPDFELGGHGVVADALHGWIRDDSWVVGSDILRVVARPVEARVDDVPIGAIVGAKVVSPDFAEYIANRVGAAVSFFANGTAQAKGVPERSSSSSVDLEISASDLKFLTDDKDYNEKGRTAPTLLKNVHIHSVHALFNRLPGEAWDMGAGYAVVYRQPHLASPLDFQTLADENDKKAVPTVWIVLIAVGASLLGIVFSVLEHTLPIHRFRKSVHELATGKVDVLKPGTFRGAYKKIALDINDGLDKVASKSGVERGPADLERVLGPLPAQPQMSAFSVPGPDEMPFRERSVPKAAPKVPAAQPSGTLPSAGLSAEERADVARAMAEPEAPAETATPSPPPASSGPATPAPRRAPPAPPRKTRDDEGAPAHGEEPPLSAPADGDFDEEADWHRVYDEFMALKRQLGEPVEKLTYEKFRGTLQRNKDALVSRHQCKRVQFKVYEKEGKAALKASPVK